MVEGSKKRMNWYDKNIQFKLNFLIVAIRYFIEPGQCLAITSIYDEE